MLRPVLFAALAAIALTSTAGADFVAGPARDPGPAGSGAPQITSKNFNCSVSGTPVEFPNDIRLVRAVGPTEAGTFVKWSVPGTPYSGFVTLPALAAGQSFRISNVLPGLPAGTRCIAALD